MNFESPLFTRKRLNKWRPPWEWPRQTFLERQIPVEITNESRHVAVSSSPSSFGLLVNASRLQLLIPSPRWFFFFFLAFISEGLNVREHWVRISQGLLSRSTDKCLWLSSAGQVSLHFWACRVKFFKASAMRYFSTTGIKPVKQCVPSGVKRVEGSKIMWLRRPRGIKYINNNHVCFY